MLNDVSDITAPGDGVFAIIYEWQILMDGNHVC